MPLYDANHLFQGSPKDAVTIVHDFLIRCRQWANDTELPARREKALDSAAEAEKLRDWVTYLAFTDHTIRELEDGTLDHWFQDPAK